MPLIILLLVYSRQREIDGVRGIYGDVWFWSIVVYYNAWVYLSEEVPYTEKNG